MDRYYFILTFSRYVIMIVLLYVALLLMLKREKRKLRMRKIRTSSRVSVGL